MREGWEKRNLGDVLEVLRNGVNCEQDKSGHGQRITRIETIANAEVDFEKVGSARLTESDKQKYRIYKGDVLFSHINSPPHVGKTARLKVEEELYHGVNLLLMRPKAIVTPEFFEHYLKFLFLSGYWRNVCKQSVNQASVNQQDINKVEIEFPKSLPEQHRIVAILDEVFDSITRAKDIAERNLRNARELFETCLQNAFTNRGEGWEVRTLGEIAEIKGGKRVPKGSTLQKEPTDHPYIRVTDFNDEGSIDLDDIHYVNDLIFNEIRNYTININDLYISIAGTIGKTGMIPEELDKANLTENACKLVFKSNISPRFVYYFTQSNDFKDQAGLNTRTAAMPKLALVRLATISLVLPCLNEQMKIVETFDALIAEVGKLESIYISKLTVLEELKKSFLQKAFNGELP